MADKTPAQFKPVMKRRVTRPILKMKVDEPVFVKAIGKLYEGKEIKGSGENAQMKPATLLDVIDLTTGEEAQIVCGTVLHGILEDNYKDGAYVGKCFQFTKKASAGTKRYFNYDVIEIEDPTAAKK